MKAAMTAIERDLKRVCGRKKVEDLRRWKKSTGFGFSANMLVLMLNIVKR